MQGFQPIAATRRSTPKCGDTRGLAAFRALLAKSAWRRAAIPTAQNHRCAWGQKWRFVRWIVEARLRADQGQLHIGDSSLERSAAGTQDFSRAAGPRCSSHSRSQRPTCRESRTPSRDRLSVGGGAGAAVKRPVSNPTEFQKGRRAAFCLIVEPLPDGESNHG
jgi:hypothetical protein